MATRSQTSNNLDAAVVSATASTIQASGLGAYAGYHLAIVSSTVGAAGQMRYAYTSAGRTDVLKVTPEFDTVPAVNDDLSVAKNHANYDSDWGNDFKLVLKAAAEWDVGATNVTLGNGSNHMVGGIYNQGFSQDAYWYVRNGSYFAMGATFAEQSIGGWYWNSNDGDATLGYQFIRVETSATVMLHNVNLGTVYAHAPLFQVGSNAYFYDVSFTNLMYNGARVKGNVYGKNLKFQGAGVSNDYVVVTSTLATFEGPIVLSDSYGFISSALAETIDVNKYISVNNTRDVTANNSTTWHFHNPTWDNPQILWTQSTGQSSVSEIFTLTGAVTDTAGSALSSAVGCLIQGSATARTTHFCAVVSTDGTFTEEVLKRHWASSTASTTYGPFISRAWAYGYNPFEGAITFDGVTNLPIALGVDLESTTSTEASAVGYADIQVFQYATALTAVAYASGTTPFVTSAVVSGATSGAHGTVREYLGDATSGTVVLINRDATAFTGNENLFVLGSRIAEASTSFNEDYTYEVYCSAQPVADAYDNHMARLATTSAAVDAWVSTARERSTRLIDAVGGTYQTEAYFSTGVWVSKRGTGTINYMTSDSGTQYVPPVQYSFTLTGLKSGSEVRILDSTTLEFIDGTESSSTSYAYNYTYGGSDIDIIVVIFHLNWKEVRLTGLSLSNLNQSIPIQQQIDRVYANP